MRHRNLSLQKLAPRSHHVLIRKVLPVLAAVAFSVATLHAQETTVTPFQKQFQRLDLGVTAAALLNKSVSGPVNAKTSAPNQGKIVGDAPSNTVGAIATLRYVARPFVGFEFNYGYARYTQNYSNVPGQASNIGAQANATEYTFGYLVTPNHQIFGLEPFISAGAGVTAFRPTPGGGLGFNPQARATYYYNVGLQHQFPDSHFGARAGFRQTIFLAPDFGQNYLTILQRTSSSQPYLGFFLKF